MSITLSVQLVFVRLLVSRLVATDVDTVAAVCHCVCVSIHPREGVTVCVNARVRAWQCMYLPGCEHVCVGVSV